MSSETFDLRTMSVEDLFRAKQERRQRLARLSFEQKIEIVKKLQSVSRKIQAEGWRENPRGLGNAGMDK